MIEFFQNHKKQCIVSAVISVIIFAVYIFWLFKYIRWLILYYFFLS